MIAESGDSTEAEKAMAIAIANIEHQATAADQNKLNAIIADDDTPTELRDLASIVLSLSQFPSAADKAKFEKLFLTLWFFDLGRRIGLRLGEGKYAGNTDSGSRVGLGKINTCYGAVRLNQEGNEE